MSRNFRTDIAAEAHLHSADESGNLPGVKIRQELIDGFEVTAVDVLDSRGASALNKQPGQYYTFDLGKAVARGSEAFPAAAGVLSSLLRRCLPSGQNGLVLIAALGNPDITPDALGSLAASNILVTRHLTVKEPENFSAFRPVALCRTGVLGTTGVESALQIKSLCDLLKPCCVLAIDALAGSEFSHLCRTVQINNTGIAPGSGIGNNRAELDRDYLGVPVVAVGVPTVIDAAVISDLKECDGLFVTPRTVDASVRSAGRLIGYGVNLALHSGLSVYDIDLLLG